MSVVSVNGNFVLNTSQSAQLSLNDDTVIVSVLNDLLGDGDVLFEGLGREHHYHQEGR